MKRAAVLAFFVLPLAADSRNQVFSDFSTPLPLPARSTLVLGIVGGWERWDAPQRVIRRVALRIRERKLPGVWVETVENHKIQLAQELLVKAFPDPAQAGIVLYGQSLGGSATVRLARWLGERGYPVKLMIAIDSVGYGDRLVPPNVAAAMNLYQRDSWPIIGENSMRPEDPLRTRMLDNRRFRYRGKTIDLENEPWIRRAFLKGHLKMEYDPEVWELVERTILETLQP